jgi:broad specificity phosphatase PhoE
LSLAQGDLYRKSGKKGLKALTIVYLARHGSTEWNESPRFRGTAEIPLSKRSFKQAERLAFRLRQQKLAAIYSSPLLRVRGTAEPISRTHQLPIKLRDGRKSINYGRWGGLSEEEVSHKEPELYQQYLVNIESLRFPGGETLEDLRLRAMQVLNEVVCSYPQDEVVLITHQVVSRVLLCAILGAGNHLYWRFGQDPGCLNIIEQQEGIFNLLRMNVIP